MEETTYKTFKKCYRMTNDTIDLIVTADVGPRIIHFGFVNKENMFGEPLDFSVKVGNEEWRLYGGHRLWHSPEANPRTYSPDNSPVAVEKRDDCLRVTQPVESLTGIQKQMDIYMSDTRNHVRVIHRLTNRGQWPVTLAVWALSAMNRDGIAVIPQPQGDPESLLPNRRLVIWPYTNMAAPCVRWGNRYITVTQSRANPPRFKIGIAQTEGWVAYARDTQLFLKRFEHHAEKEYPDGGCSVEVFTCPDFLEVETLGPLSVLNPGDTVEHTEDWYLFDKVKVADDDTSIDENILPLVQGTRL